MSGHKIAEIWTPRKAPKQKGTRRVKRLRAKLDVTASMSPDADAILEKNVAI